VTKGAKGKSRIRTMTKRTTRRRRRRTRRWWKKRKIFACHF